jgi:hypothetical protein
MKKTPQGRPYTLLAVSLLACLGGRTEAIGGQAIDTRHVYEQASPAVVLIISQKAGAPVAQGSGAIVSKDGVIISALHVVENADHAVVKLMNGDIYDDVLVVAIDPRKDLVVLKIAGFDLPTIPLGNSNEVKEGDPVAMLSNPRGLEQSITQGIVSGVRDLPDVGLKVIQTTAAASPGSSGGALLNAKGELVAILSFKVVGGESLNFGIPINYARGMLTSQGSFALSALASRIAEMPATPMSKLGSAGPKDISGDWLSLVSGSRFRVRLEGEHIYVERLFTDEQRKFNPFQMCDLTEGKDRYLGTCRVRFPVTTYYVWTRQTESKLCYDEFRMEFTKHTPTRIEGGVEQRMKSSRDWTGREWTECGQHVPKEWQEFVWIRAE